MEDFENQSTDVLLVTYFFLKKYTEDLSKPEENRKKAESEISQIENEFQLRFPINFKNWKENDGDWMNIINYIPNSSSKISVVK